MSDRVINFATRYKIVSGLASGPEDVLTDALKCPASGSFVDVTGFESVNIVVKLGAVVDDFTLEVQCSDAADGTPDTLDATNAKHTIANASDDDQLVVFTIETANLPADHHFLTLSVDGIVGSNYADVIYFLTGARSEPVTQPADLPAAHQYFYGG